MHQGQWVTIDSEYYISKQTVKDSFKTAYPHPQTETPVVKIQIRQLYNHEEGEAEIVEFYQKIVISM